MKALRELDPVLTPVLTPGLTPGLIRRAPTLGSILRRIRKKQPQMNADERGCVRICHPRAERSHQSESLHIKSRIICVHLRFKNTPVSLT
jgi:hypothetical protein